MAVAADTDQITPNVKDKCHKQQIRPENIQNFKYPGFSFV
jgi:hypothetical protein